MRNPGRRFDVIESQAAAWLARRDGGMSVGEKSEFDRWCAADPRHAAAVREIAAVWTALDRPTAAGQVESLRAALDALDRRRRRRWMAGGAATTLAAAAGLVVLLGLLRPSSGPPSALADAAPTARVIEPKRQTLPDGSIVELRHGAEITVAFDDANRVVKLASGEAHFSVTKNPRRPFVVETGNVKISAVGTAFAVEVGRTEVEVLVTEGRVRVHSTPSVPPVRRDPPTGQTPGPSAVSSAPLVEAGQRAVVSLGAAGSLPLVVSVPAAEFAERLAWRLPRLEFSETSVADAIAMFNRHNRLQLQVADSAAAARRITGVFRADNVEGFVRALESSLGLQAERRAGEIRLHSAK